MKMEAEKDDIYDSMDQVKVLVATPNYTNMFESSVHTNHIECVSKWTEWGIDFNWTIIGRTFVQFARTQLCQVAADGKFTHIFFVDDDAVIDPETLPRFIKHDKDIIMAPYPMRRYPHEIGVLSAENWRDHGTYENLTFDDMDQGLIEVAGGGTHCMLIKVDVFHKKGTIAHSNSTETPSLFEEDEEALRVGPGGTSGTPFFVMPKTGTEDMYFCYRAKLKGAEVWCDTDVFADHVGFSPVITRSWAEYGETSKKQNRVKSNGKELTFIAGSDERSEKIVRLNKAANIV